MADCIIKSVEDIKDETTSEIEIKIPLEDRLQEYNPLWSPSLMKELVSKFHEEIKAKKDFTIPLFEGVNSWDDYHYKKLHCYWIKERNAYVGILENYSVRVKPYSIENLLKDAGVYK